MQSAIAAVKPCVNGGYPRASFLASLFQAGGLTRGQRHPPGCTCTRVLWKPAMRRDEGLSKPSLGSCIPRDGGSSRARASFVKRNSLLFTFSTTTQSLGFPRFGLKVGCGRAHGDGHSQSLAGPRSRRLCSVMFAPPTCMEGPSTLTTHATRSVNATAIGRVHASCLAASRTRAYPIHAQLVPKIWFRIELGSSFGPFNKGLVLRGSEQKGMDNIERFLLDSRSPSFFCGRSRWVSEPLRSAGVRSDLLFQSQSLTYPNADGPPGMITAADYLDGALN